MLKNRTNLVLKIQKYLLKNVLKIIIFAIFMKIITCKVLRSRFRT